MLLPHVGIDSHDLWLDLVMKERRGSTCHERIAPSLSPLSHHLPHCVWLIHSCIYFLFLLPLFQRGSPYFKPVFVNPFWSADANTLNCALERIDWSWTLFIPSNKIVIRSNFVAWWPAVQKEGQSLRLGHHRQACVDVNQVRGLPGGHFTQPSLASQIRIVDF